MKKMVLGIAALVGVAGIALADPIYDWGALKATHENIHTAIQHIEDIQRANAGQFGGHAEKAKQLMRQAEHELQEAAEFRKHER